MWCIKNSIWLEEKENHVVIRRLLTIERKLKLRYVDACEHFDLLKNQSDTELIRFNGLDDITLQPYAIIV